MLELIPSKLSTQERAGFPRLCDERLGRTTCGRGKCSGRTRHDNVSKTFPTFVMLLNTSSRPGDASFDSGTSFWGTNLTIVSDTQAWLLLSRLRWLLTQIFFIGCLEWHCSRMAH